jgi:hypothetical protein
MRRPALYFSIEHTAHIRRAAFAGSNAPRIEASKTNADKSVPSDNAQFNGT